ncbi:PAS domain-containing protein [Ancylobacter novellus]|nr:PAS domain-containing protein [Ancylobacter novellus]
MEDKVARRLLAAAGRFKFLSAPEWMPTSSSKQAAANNLPISASSSWLVHLTAALIAGCFITITFASFAYLFLTSVGSEEIAQLQEPSDERELLITLLGFIALTGSASWFANQFARRRLIDDSGAGAERELRNAINTIPAIVWSTSPDGNNDFHNQRLLAYTGVDAATALGMGWVDMLHPEDLERHVAAWRDAVATGTAFECESRLKRSDGQYRWFLARAEPLRDPSGRVVRWYGTNVDIDDRRRAEEALRRSDAYLAEAQKLSRTGSAVWNLATGEVVCSDEFYSIFGFAPRSRLSVEMILQRTHPDDATFVRRELARAVAEVGQIDLEHRLLMEDGSVKHVHLVAHSTRDAQERCELVGAVMDVTARTKAYAALEASECRYRHLFDHMPVALGQLDLGEMAGLFAELRASGVTDLDAHFDAHPDLLTFCQGSLVITAANGNLIRLLGGTDEGAIIGRSALGGLLGSSDTIRRSLVSCFRMETSFQDETKIETIDGRRIDVLFTSSITSSGPDRDTGVLGLIDISQRIRAEEGLRRVQADYAHSARVSTLGQLTASIAHEINQPLAAIATHGEAGLRWLDNATPDLDEVRKSTRQVIANAHRASDIVGRIRAMAVRREQPHEVLAFDTLLRETILFLRHEAQSRGVTIIHRNNADNLAVRADRVQLQQVVVNLIMNSIQAMADSEADRRRITINTTPDGMAALLCHFDDSGPGIRPEHLPRLFESFFTTKCDGMGIGLPICRSIIEAHGGSMSAENGGAEGGARFILRLPTDVSSAN